jgi:hypothetical protein
MSIKLMLLVRYLKLYNGNDGNGNGFCGENTNE